MDEDAAGLAALRAAAAEAGRDLAALAGHWLFLRHGRTAGNLRRTYQHPDDPLSPEGFADADAAARLIPAARPNRIVASDMPRAWLTAGRVAAATGLPVGARPGLRERYFGDWIGRPIGVLDWSAAPPGGETLAVFVARTVAALAAVVAEGGRPLVVAHRGTLWVLAGALGVTLPPEHAANALPLLVSGGAGRWSMRPLTDAG